MKQDLNDFEKFDVCDNFLKIITKFIDHSM